MFSTVQRLNTLSNLWINALLIVCLWMTISVYFDKREAASEVQLTAAERKTTRIYHAFRNVRQEYAFLEFELETGGFLCVFRRETSFLEKNQISNEKRLKATFSLEYEASVCVCGSIPYNEVMVWNRIVRNKREAVIRIRNQKNMFAFNDIEGSFANKNVTLSMHYNVMPQVGLLTWGNGKPSGRLPFSVSY
ncbi:hypothetical protein PMAC_000783 [Pneumocystis sp. 'macacae']|nr:hypothetical protein PMAC_000783 [Pneumocystis sp. 'macacae']